MIGDSYHNQEVGIRASRIKVSCVKLLLLLSSISRPPKMIHMSFHMAETINSRRLLVLLLLAAVFVVVSDSGGTVVVAVVVVSLLKEANADGEPWILSGKIHWRVSKL